MDKAKPQLMEFVIVSPKTPTNRFKFIITTNGNPEYFRQLINLVDNAPLLKDWNFTAYIDCKEAFAGNEKVS